MKGEIERRHLDVVEPRHQHVGRDGEARRAAREGHATTNGGVSVLATPNPATTPPTTDLRITYTPPEGLPQVITITGLPTGVVASGGHTITGRISEGTNVLRLP